MHHAAIQFLAIGLSHVVQAHVWVEFFIWLRNKGHAGVFVNGFLCLGFGSFIVAFHNVWEGLPIVFTLIGWAQLLKGLLAFVVPQLGLRTFARVSHERSWEFRVGGVFFLVLSGVLVYHLLMGE